MSNTPQDWIVTANDGTNLTANNPTTGETFTGLVSTFNMFFSGSPSGNDLLNNAAATGQSSGKLNGGVYIWKTIGTFAGATLTLQTLGPDGSTWQNVTSMTAPGQIAINVGDGEVAKVSVSGGSPAGLFSNLVRVS